MRLSPSLKLLRRSPRPRPPTSTHAQHRSVSARRSRRCFLIRHVLSWSRRFLGKERPRFARSFPAWSLFFSWQCGGPVSQEAVRWGLSVENFLSPPPSPSVKLGGGGGCLVRASPGNMQILVRCSDVVASFLPNVLVVLIWYAGFVLATSVSVGEVCFCERILDMDHGVVQKSDCVIKKTN